MNPFESGERKVIPATLIYIFCEKKILMIHRIKKDKDIHEGKWNGIGGKLELEESPADGALREITEETGLEIPAEKLKSIGFLTFPSFKAEQHQDWICFVFKVKLDGKTADYPLIDSNEGHLEWIEEQKVTSLPLWEGDKDFIPMVIGDKLFLGSYWYTDKKLIKQKLQSIGTMG
jgi:8-oxo-dGTP diphosphatase